MNPDSSNAASLHASPDDGLLKDAVGDAIQRGKAGIAESAAGVRDSLAVDLTKLRADIAGMQETVSKFASQAGGEAARAARNVGQAVASQAGHAAGEIADVGSDVAAAATRQVRTIGSELENIVRRNPVGIITGALLAGVLIGAFWRIRSQHRG
jgi:hypothetical protein